MAEILRMPEVAAGAQSALLSSWPIAAGASFATGDVIAIIETDKAVVDLPADRAGVLVRALAVEGAEVAIGDPIAVIAESGEVIADIEATIAALLGAAPASQPEAEAPPVMPAPSPDGADLLPSPQAAPAAGIRGERIFASPLARRLAREAGLDLASITGSGPQGRIRRRDIEQALAAGPLADSGPPAAAPVGERPGAEAIPHTRLRRAIATRLTQSKAQSPHFYLRGSAQVDRLLALRSEINEGEEIRVSVTDLLLKAMAEAFARVPRAHVTWTDDALLRHSSVDIGLAVATETGLMTPVVRGIESRGIRDIARATADLAMRARSGSLRQHELEGGVTTLTNLGMYGTEDFDAIINPPQSSILAVGAAREVPVARDGALAVGTVMRFSLSVDHRPIDGATAAEWMAAFTQLVERPGKLLLG